LIDSAIALTNQTKGRECNSMAVYQPVVGTVQCQLFGRVDGQITINDLYFQAAGAVTPAGVDTLVTDIASWFGGNLATILSDDWATERVVGTDLTTATGYRKELAAVTIGGVTGEANPNNVAAVVSLRTNQRGRSARGRNFVPAIPGAAVTLNTLDPAFISDLITQYSFLIGPGTFSVGWELVVVSRVTGGVSRAAGLAIPVTGVIMVTNTVRSMRSREVGHGA
jgi:hypothetical protein